MVAAQRILSLIPAATDWVVALGLQERLVGVTHECEVPDGVPAPQVVVSPAVHHDPSDPAGVDASVTAAATAGQALYEIDAEAVAALAPTVVLTQRLCDVCAVSEPAVEAVTAAIPGCRVLTLDGVTLGGVLDDGLRAGAALGADGTAAAVVSALRERLARVEAAVAGRARPRVGFLEWTDPPWTAGHWVPDQVAAAGGEALATRSGQPSRRAGWDAFAGADVVVVGPCGYDLPEAVRAADAAADRLPPGARWAVDAHHAFSRPAAGLVDGVEALAGILHGEAVGAPDARLARRLASHDAAGSRS